MERQTIMEITSDLQDCIRMENIEQAHNEVMGCIVVYQRHFKDVLDNISSLNFFLNKGFFRDGMKKEIKTAMHNIYCYLETVVRAMKVVLKNNINPDEYDVLIPYESITEFARFLPTLIERLEEYTTYDEELLKRDAYELKESFNDYKEKLNKIKERNIKLAKREYPYNSYMEMESLLHAYFHILYEYLKTHDEYCVYNYTLYCAYEILKITKSIKIVEKKCDNIKYT